MSNDKTVKTDGGKRIEKIQRWHTNTNKKKNNELTLSLKSAIHMDHIYALWQINSLNCIHL